MQQADFEFSSVEWSYTESKEIAVQRRPPVRTGIASLSVLCMKCGESWRASNFGRGHIRSVFGGVYVECPSCQASTTVSAETLE